MKRTTAPGSAGGQYVDDNPALGVVGTLLIAADRNAVQEEIVNAIEGAGLTPTDAEDDQLWKAIEARADESVVNLALFRNKIINGNFDFWQRGTSVAVASGETKYLADRFSVYVAGSSAATTYSRQLFTPGQVEIPNNPKYFARSLCTNGGDATNGLHIMKQWIENVTTCAGKKVTFSFWAKADAAKNVAVEITQLFGTGGSPSASVNTFIAKIALTASWQKFVLTFDVPSITGKTIGSDGYNTSALGITFFMSAGSTFAGRTDTLGIQTGTFDFAQIQIEEGELATKFEERPPQVELALCQRYFEKIGGSNSTSLRWVGYGATTGNFFTPLAFKVTKRKDPTCALLGAWTVSNCGQPVVSLTSVDHVTIAATTTTLGQFDIFTNDVGDYISADAEF